jgi:hypothetical protein
MLTLKYIAYAYLFISLYHALKFVDDPEFRKVASATNQDKFRLDLMHPAFRGMMFFILLAITALSWPLGAYYKVKASYGNWKARKIMESILREQGIGMESRWPVYKCHKQVRAFKIKGIVNKANPDPTGQTAAASYGAFIFSDGTNGCVADAHFMTKHNPQVGGYIVVYEDGYTSYSPAKAFEEGYTRIDPIGSHERSGQKAQQDEKNRHLSQVAAAIANVKSAEQP